MFYTQSVQMWCKGPHQATEGGDSEEASWTREESHPTPVGKSLGGRSPK